MQLEGIKQLFMGVPASTRKINDWIANKLDLPTGVSLIISTLSSVYKHQTKEAISKLAQEKKLVTKLLDFSHKHIAQFSEEDIKSVLAKFEQRIFTRKLEKELVTRFENSLANPEKYLWKKAVRSAVIAKDLAPSLKLDPAEAFVAALTHRYPEILMSDIEPDNYHEAIKGVLSGKKLRSSVLAQFGFEYCELGEKISRYIGLSETITNLHKFGFEAKDVKLPKMANLVIFSDFIARAFADKAKSPSKMWNEAQPFIESLDLSFDKDTWANKISILFVKTLEF